MSKYTELSVRPYLLQGTYWLVSHTNIHQDLCRGEDYLAKQDNIDVWCLDQKVGDSLIVADHHKATWISITKEKYDCLRNLL